MSSQVDPLKHIPKWSTIKNYQIARPSHKDAAFWGVVVGTIKSLEEAGYLTNHEFTSVILAGMPLRDVMIYVCFRSAVLPAA